MLRSKRILSHTSILPLHTSQVQMTDGPIARQLLSFTFPILLSQLLQQFYNIADTAIIGQHLGADSLAATGTAGLLLSVIVNFFIGLSAGISVIISHLFGKRQYENLNSCIQTAVAASILLGFIFTAAGISGISCFLKWLDTPSEIIPPASCYLKICFLGMAAQLVYNIGTAILRALGNTFSALYYLIIASLLNLLLDVLFLIVFPMGIAGAAMATLISQYLSAILIVWKLFHMDGIFSLKISRPFIQPCYLLQSFQKGIPSGMQAVFMSISSLVIQTYINSFGYSTMAGMTVYAKVEGFLYYPLFSFGLALTAFIGQNAGAGRLDRIEKGVKISMRIAVLGSIVISLIMIKLAPFIISVFTSDASVLKNGVLAVYYTFPFYWLYAVNQVFIGSIRGLGQTFYPMFTSLCSYCIFRIFWCSIWEFCIHDMCIVYTSYDVSWILMLALLAGGYRHYSAKYARSESCFS